jgi:hypothetical protein
MEPIAILRSQLAAITLEKAGLLIMSDSDALQRASHVSVTAATTKGQTEAHSRHAHVTASLVYTSVDLTP